MVRPVVSTSSSAQGSIFDSCCQKLRDLASAIKRVTLQFFQCLFPCFFRSHQTSTSTLKSVEIQPSPQLTQAQIEREERRKKIDAEDEQRMQYVQELIARQ